MEERRRSIRQKCFLRGRVYFDGGRKSVDCLIRDISYYEGARIIFYDPVNIPDVVQLYIPDKKLTLRHASRGATNKVGLAFFHAASHFTSKHQAGIV